MQLPTSSMRRLGLLWPGYPEPTPDPAGGNGGGTGGGGNGGGQYRPPVSQLVAGVVARHGGDAHAALSAVLGDNASYRQRHKQDVATIAQLQAKVPADAVVLNAEQAKEWAAYQALGKPDEVKKVVDKVAALEGTVAEHAHTELLAKAAGAVADGVAWRPSVVADIVKAKGLHVELKEVKEKDARGVEHTLQRPYVRLAANATATPEPLQAWVQANAAEYLPALPAATAVAGSGFTGSAGGVPMPGGTSSNGGGTGGAGGGAVAARLRRNAEQATAGNALVPKVATAAT